MLSEYGDAASALEALPQIAREAGIDDYAACPASVAEAELRAGRAAGADLIFLGTPHYPTALLDPEDPPPFLWVKGDPSFLHRPLLAIVGSRNASSLGTRMAKSLAHDLGAKGFSIVSGLARGIDTAAHNAALASGTVAVMAGGVDVVYPPENANLFDEIGARGARVSEQPIGLAPFARHFPRRNRLISGLARAVIVVEAAAKSGSLITARNALDQGRDVLAVPGHPFDARAAGCNMLIRNGATLVRSARDVIEALGDPAEPELPLAPARSLADPRIPAPPPQRRGLAETAQLHQIILDRLGSSPIAEDQLFAMSLRPRKESRPC